MKYTIILMALLSAAIVMAALVMSYEPSQTYSDYNNDVDFQVTEAPKFELYIATTTKSFWDRVHALNSTETEEEPEVPAFVTDEDGNNIAAPDNPENTEAPVTDVPLS